MLEHPTEVVAHLRDAEESLTDAHRWAGEVEGNETNLVGPVRDLLFGLNSAVGALASLIAESEA